MEENIKRVEKLVHATNTALAQMKFSLMFDDINGEKNKRAFGCSDRILVDKFLNGNDLTQCQKEFHLEANKMLEKVEEMFTSNETNRKNSKAINRIKEINKEINGIRLGQSKPEETEQSRQKLFSLISEEKFSPDVTSIRRSVESKPSISFNWEKDSVEKTHLAPRKNGGSLFSITTESPVKSKVELKNKILETQEIVDRGLLTAKQLAQKVEWMTKWDKKEKTPSSDKTISENNLTSLEKKTESNETIKIVKCRRHSEKEKKKERNVQEVEQVNTQVVDVKRKELHTRVKSNLQLQRLPSVHIRGGLKLQRVHNLEIPANEDNSCEKLNTAISFLSHEQMEKKKMEKIVENIRRENCYCIEDSIHRNYVECFNCGKLNRVRDAWVDPRKIDEILHQCNFNVFDPRIDEFAEKFATVDIKNCSEASEPLKTLQSDVIIPEELKVKLKDVDKKVETKYQSENLKKSKYFTLREFSNQIFKKYKEEVETLEDNHLKLESVLQNLFTKVDESRKIFEDCHFLKNLNVGSEKIPNLTSTKPILVTLSGSSSKNKKRQKKLSRKNMNRIKSEVESTEPKREDKKILYPTSSLSRFSEAKNTRERVLSFMRFNENGNVKPNATDLQGRSGSLTRKISNTERLEKKEEVEEKLSSVASTSASKSQNSSQLETSKKKKNTEKTPMASIQRKTTKSLDEIHREEEMLNRSFSNKGKATKLPDTKIEKLEEDKIPVVSASASSNKSSGTSTQSNAVKDMFKKKDTEIESHVISSKNKIKSETEESTSEKSENIYESDFESFTNELEEKGNEFEEEEPELIPCLKKLSTISEVDSELEKKFSEEQKATGSYFGKVDSLKAFETGVHNIALEEKNSDLLTQKEDNSVFSEISSKNKKTSETSLKSTPTELVTSLKDILSALQDQFAKTESLAEKLTENVKMKKREKIEVDLAPMISSSWRTPAADKLVENLQSARKNWTCTPKLSPSLIMPEKIGSEESEKSEEDMFADSLYDEGGSSLGEIVVTDRKSINSAKSGNSSILDSNVIDMDSAKRSTCVS